MNPATPDSPHRQSMSAAAPVHRNALPPGTVLLWYCLERVLGQGAFGITYLAVDTNLHRPVAIKEFLPAALTHREDDGSVLAQSDELLEEYTIGLQRFIAEARTLAKFEHANIVRVHNTFEANRTAYMVMRYEEGEGLDRLLKARGTLTEDEILQILHPLLDGLAVIHAQGFVHRDIKPANIFIRTDGTPVLLDFGSARQASGDEARTLTNFVSPGYAPIEQYAGKSDQQGPWSDIYGLGATIYRAMTGRAPNDAIDRSQSIAQHTHDSYQAGAAHAKRTYSATLLAAVDHALGFRVQERPRNVAEWRAELPPPVTTEVATADWHSAASITPRADAGAPTIAVTLPATLAASPAATTRQGTALATAIGAPLAAVATAIEAAAMTSAPAAALLTPVRPSAPAAKRRRNLAVVAALTALAVSVGVWFGRSLGPSGAAGPTNPTAQAPAAVATVPDNDPATSAATPAAATAASAASAAAPVPLPPPPAVPDERIAGLLLAASSDLQALRLTSPPANNAYEKYREVLRLAPDNPAARQGIDAISDRYLGLAYREIKAGRVVRAERFIANAEQITPGRPTLTEARRALAAPQTLAPAATATTPGAAPTVTATEHARSLRERFRDFVREQKRLQDATPDSRGDQLRDRIGGRP